MARAIKYKPTREYSVSAFGGVDLSSSPVKVAPGRASEMKNFYLDEGSLKKRPGFRQVSEQLHGRVEKILKMGEKNFVFTLAEEIGLGFVYEAWLEDGELRCNKISSFNAEIIEVFYNKERLYILTGSKYLVLYSDGDEYVVKDARDGAFIPTTTVGIADTISVEPSLRYTLDAVNMITPYRKNKLKVRDTVSHDAVAYYYLKVPYAESQGGSGKRDDPYVWEFDYNVGNKKAGYGKYTVTIDVILQDGDRMEYMRAIHTTIAKASDSIYEFMSYQWGEFTRIHVYDYLKVRLDVYRNKLIVEAVNENATGVIPSPIGDAENAVISILYEPILSQSFLLDGKIGNGQVTVNVTTRDGDTIEYSGPDSDSMLDKDGKKLDCEFAYGDDKITFSNASNYSEIEVVFPCASERNGVPYTDVIGRCRFGCIFGTTGNSNRLFLSGNPAFPNVEFWSDSEDYGYFPDLNYNTVGTDISKIVGYARLSDEVLAVFKEKSGQEPTVYYKSGDYRQSYDDRGNLVYAVTTFPTYAGNTGETIISRRASVNLEDDALILSENGVFGIVMRENVNTEERYMTERSRLINKELTASRELLKRATAAVYKGRYYLSLGDGRVFVADSRYKCSLEGDRGSYNYEWFLFDGIPAVSFGEIDGELYFGTEDGRICMFDGESCDRLYHKFKANAGYFLNPATDGAWMYNNSEKDGIYRLIKPGYKIKINVSYTSDSTPAYDVRGYIHNKFTDGEGSSFFNVTNFSDGTDDEIITDFLKEKAEKYTISSITIEEKREIEAIWRSGITALGSIREAKSLLSMTVSVSASNGGVLKFGYKTKYGSDERDAKGIQHFDLEDLDFTRFSFDNDFQSSYTVRCYERNFNYIQFAFSSPKGKATVNDFTVIYKINKKIKGVR